MDSTDRRNTYIETPGRRFVVERLTRLFVELSGAGKSVATMFNLIETADFNYIDQQD